ncbi:MAG: hypothetical protein JWQ21_2419 [Herminiimonas sp.]|nr:hypothetical protein [Herminiimonas sp.]
MNMLFKKISISLLLMISMVSAFANPGQNRGDRDAAHAARQQQRAMDQGESQGGRQQQYRQFDQGRQPDNGNPNAGPDGSRKPGRMSPEERRALRRQINEAGHDIYVKP